MSEKNNTVESAGSPQYNLDTQLLTIMTVINKLYDAVKRFPMGLDIAVPKDEHGGIDWDACYSVVESCMLDLEKNKQAESPKEEPSKCEENDTEGNVVVFGGDI